MEFVFVFALCSRLNFSFILFAKYCASFYLYNRKSHSFSHHPICFAICGLTYSTVCRAPIFNFMYDDNPLVGSSPLATLMIMWLFVQHSQILVVSIPPFVSLVESSYVLFWFPFYNYGFLFFFPQLHVIL